MSKNDKNEETSKSVIDKKTDEKNKSKRLTGRTKINVLHASKTTSNHKRETAEKTSEPNTTGTTRAQRKLCRTARTPRRA